MTKNIITPVVLSSFLLTASAQALTPISVNDVQDEAFSSLGTSFTMSNYTVSSSINSPLLVIAVAIESVDASVTGITFGGQSLSLASELELPDGGNAGYSGIFYLTNPTLDAANDITVTTGATTSTLALSAFTLSNVNQITPIGDTDTFGDAAGATDPSTSLTTVGNDSMLISSLMTGGNQVEYSVASPGAQVTEIGGGFSGVYLELGSWEGGSIGNTTSLQFDGGTTTRVAIASAEFIAVPEPSHYALIGGVITLGVLLIRRRKA